LAQRVGLTRGKAATIGVLAVVLVGVVYIQYGSSDDRIAVLDAEPPAAPPPQPAAASPAVPVPAAAAESSTAAAITDDEEQTAVTAQFEESKWKSPQLTMVVAYDPFALPSAFPQPVRTAAGSEAVEGGDGSAENAETAAAKLAEAIESLQGELRALQERGVHVIIRGRDEYVAMIGDRTIRVGDEINGFVVTAIEADGVRVERKLAE
jgi:hypothetical protein